MSDPGLSKLLRPRSVAVVGASSRAGSTGLRLLQHLRMGGFAGPIYPINPRYPEILGIKCYPSLSDAPGPIDAMGGVGDIRGAILASFILGLTETAVATYIDPGLTLAAAYILFIAILLVRPEGLFGRRPS